MKLCHLCTDGCRKSTKASTSDPGDAQQRTCLVIRSVTDLLMIDGLICLDFVDVSSVMRDGGPAVVGIGEAASEETAIKAAISDLKRQLAVIPMSSEASLDMLSD
jgi:cell division GTPase FtsZ